MDSSATAVLWKGHQYNGQQVRGLVLKAMAEREASAHVAGLSCPVHFVAGSLPFVRLVMALRGRCSVQTFFDFLVTGDRKDMIVRNGMPPASPGHRPSQFAQTLLIGCKRCTLAVAAASAKRGWMHLVHAGVFGTLARNLMFCLLPLALLWCMVQVFLQPYFSRIRRQVTLRRTVISQYPSMPAVDVMMFALLPVFLACLPNLRCQLLMKPPQIWVIDLLWAAMMLTGLNA